MSDRTGDREGTITADEEAIVYIVDNNASVRSSTVHLLASVGLRGKAYDSAQAFLEDYVPEIPGCLVLDVRMPVCSGLSLLEHMDEVGIEIPVLMISAHADVPTVIRAMKKAFDFLEKPFDPQLFLDLVQTGIKRDRLRIKAWRQRRQREERFAQLTECEREVMRRIVLGQSNKVMAIELQRHESTIEFHRRGLMRKLGAHSLAEMLAICLDLQHHFEN